MINLKYIQQQEHRKSIKWCLNLKLPWVKKTKGNLCFIHGLFCQGKKIVILFKFQLLWCCFQLSTQLTLSVHQNTILIRVKHNIFFRAKLKSPHLDKRITFLDNPILGCSLPTFLQKSVQLLANCTFANCYPQHSYRAATKNASFMTGDRMST